MDRVIQSTSGAVNEIDFQMKQKIKAASNLFHYLVINGSTKNEKDFVKCQFDGIRKLLAGASTEKSADGIDLTTVENIDKYMYSFALKINKWLQTMAEQPDMLLMNGDMLAVMQYIGQKMGYFSRDKSDFGNEVVSYRGIAMVNAGRYYDGSAEKECVATDDSTGLSSIVGLKIGLDAFHGICPTEVKAFIKSYLPDLNAPGAVKTGEAEMVAGVVLKNTKMSGMLNDIKIAPTTTQAQNP